MENLKICKKVLGERVEKVEETKINVQFKTDEAIKHIEARKEYDTNGIVSPTRQEALRKV